MFRVMVPGCHVAKAGNRILTGSIRGATEMRVSIAGRVEIFRMIFMFFRARPAFVPAGNQMNWAFPSFNNNAPAGLFRRSVGFPQTGFCESVAQIGQFLS